MKMKEKLTWEERVDKFKKWIRWAWWEVLLVVFCLLMLHWFLLSMDLVKMTVTENGQVISEIEPTIRDVDYWEGGSYLSGPATRLPQVTCTDDITVQLKYSLFAPVTASVEMFSVYDVDQPMFNPDSHSELYEIDSDYRSATLTFDVEAGGEAHRVVVASATWFGILGRRQVEYVFLVSNSG